MKCILPEHMNSYTHRNPREFIWNFPIRLLSLFSSEKPKQNKGHQTFVSRISSLHVPHFNCALPWFTPFMNIMTDRRCGMRLRLHTLNEGWKLRTPNISRAYRQTFGLRRTFCYPHKANEMRFLPSSRILGWKSSGFDAEPSCSAWVLIEIWTESM